LPDFLIPGPFLYSSLLDALILTNSNLELECYKYSSLQAATNNNIAMQKAMQQDGNGKKVPGAVEPIWVTNIGEQAN
jgi:PTHB1 N-terminus